MALYYVPMSSQTVFYDGLAISGAKIFVYNAGTNTPRTAYNSSAGTTTHTSPFFTDSNGSIPPFWVVSGNDIKIVIKNTDDTVIKTIDGIPTSIPEMTSSELKSKITDETGSGPLVFADSPTINNPNIVTEGTEFVNSISELRGIVPNNDPVHVRGYYAAGDGGGDNFYPSPTVPKAQFTGAISLSVDAGAGVDNILTVISISSGVIYEGMRITGPGLSTPMYVWQHISGIKGGIGTYYVRDAIGNPLNVSVSVSSMTGTQYWDNGGTVIVPTGGDGTKAWLREINGPVNVKWFGTKNANINLTIPSVVGFATLAAAQEIYPFVTSLTQNIDQVAIQAAILFAQGSFNRQYAVDIPQGRYYTNTPIIINNVNGVKINGERTTSLYDGSFIDYSGSDFAFRLRNSKNVNLAVNNVTVTNGSPVISGVTSWPYLTEGMSILINESSWGTIQSVGVNTVTSTVNYTGSTSSTATFDSTYGGGDIYRIEMSDLGIFCTNQTYSSGAIYGRYIDECKFHRINIYGMNTIYPSASYKTMYGFSLQGCALSSFTQCHVSYVRWGWQNSRVCLQSSISECNIFAVETGIEFGDGIYGLNIDRNYIELFENGIQLVNNSFYASVDCWQMNIVGNSFQRTYGTGASRALNIQNVDNTKQLRVKVNFEKNYCNMFNFGGPAPANTDYAVSIYLDSANANSAVFANFEDNRFAFVSAAGVSINDAGLRPVITGSNNQSTTGWNNTFVKNFAFIQGSVSPLGSTYSLHRQNVAVTAPANTSENVLATLIIPPNLLKFNGAFRIKANWTLTNNANAKTLRFRFTSASGTVIDTLSAAGSASACMEADSSNRDLTNSQLVTWKNFLSSGTVSIGSGTAAIDTTSPVTVVVTAEKATSGDSIILESAHIEVLAS